MLSLGQSGDKEGAGSRESDMCTGSEDWTGKVPRQRGALPGRSASLGARSSSWSQSREALKGKTRDSHLVLSTEGGLGRIPRKGRWRDGACV